VQEEKKKRAGKGACSFNAKHAIVRKSSCHLPASRAPHCRDKKVVAFSRRRTGGRLSTTAVEKRYGYSREGAETLLRETTPREREKRGVAKGTSSWQKNEERERV